MTSMHLRKTYDVPPRFKLPEVAKFNSELVENSPKSRMNSSRSYRLEGLRQEVE